MIESMIQGERMAGETENLTTSTSCGLVRYLNNDKANPGESDTSGLLNLPDLNIPQVFELDDSLVF
jgi:hypothetical protein